MNYNAPRKQSATPTTLQSPYAPIRLRHCLWWFYSQLSAKEGHVSNTGMISDRLLSMIEESLISIYLTQFHEIACDWPNFEHLCHVQGAKVLLFRHWVPLAAQYELNGRQIFDLDDGLVEQLRETDLKDASLDSWHPPYDAFFVRFGQQMDASIPFDENGQREYLDGAFVAVTPFGAEDERRIKFGFSTVKDDGTPVQLSGYFIDLIPSEQRVPVTQGIELAMTRILSELVVDESVDERERVISSYRKTEVTDAAQLLRHATKLIVNALFYLESIGLQTGRSCPGRDTPPKQHAHWLQSTEKVKRKLGSRLTSDGYALVRMVGQEFSSGRAAGSHTVSAHWRRGHWRMQLHGHKNSEVKRLWIRPTRVAVPPLHEEAILGHIYMAPLTNVVN